MRFVVVGGGILGLATARQLVRSQPEAEVIVFERESAVAQHQTAHNSGVVHAGIYYAPGSLKARLCRRGLTLLRNFCTDRGLPYEACGKVVVATDEREIEPLRRLEERARANGVPGLRWLAGSELTAVEPHVRGVAGLHSPETAIADFAAVARAYADDLTLAGGQIRTGVTVVRIRQSGRNPRTEFADGSSLEADRVIVCAGLQADRLAMASGEPPEPRIVPFRGEYWQLRPERAHLVRGLIYPVPDPALPFLGVHLTRKIDGTVVLGPNAILSTARHAYERRRFVARDAYEALSWPGTLRMLRRHWRAGVGEIVRSASKRQFVREVARYVPAVGPSGRTPAPAGVRAQAIDRDGSLVDDFRLSAPRPRHLGAQRSLAGRDLLAGHRRGARQPRDGERLARESLTATAMQIAGYPSNTQRAGDEPSVVAGVRDDFMWAGEHHDSGRQSQRKEKAERIGASAPLDATRAASRGPGRSSAERCGHRDQRPAGRHEKARENVARQMGAEHEQAIGDQGREGATGRGGHRTKPWRRDEDDGQRQCHSGGGVAARPPGVWHVGCSHHQRRGAWLREQSLQHESGDIRADQHDAGGARCSQLPRGRARTR